MCRIAAAACTLLTLAAPATDERARWVADLRAVWELTQDHFYDPALRGVPWAAMRTRYEERLAAAEDSDAAAAVINAMLGELRTSHTAYYTDDDPAYWFVLDLFRDSPAFAQRVARGALGYVGIGVETTVLDGETFARFVLDGSPAARAGVRAGDRLVSVDGAPWHPLRPFRGQAGKPVVLRVQRERDAGSLLDLRVVPVRISPRELYRQALEDSARIVQHGGASSPTPTCGRMPARTTTTRSWPC